MLSRASRERGSECTWSYEAKICKKNLLFCLNGQMPEEKKNDQTQMKMFKMKLYVVPSFLYTG